jgi:hypothetical protein
MDSIVSAEGFVTQILGSLGLAVQTIEVGPEETPDLLVSDGTCAYLIEIKDKFPDFSKEQQRAEVLEAGGIWTEEQGLGYKNVISGVIKHGAGQLASFQGQPADFRLLWLHARDHYESPQAMQFEATLYGGVDLIDLGETPPVARPCFFFTYSEFFRLREVLDGAFVASDDRVRFCRIRFWLNSFSSRLGKLKSSQLCRAFRGGLDPIELERTGQGYVADCNISRKDQAAVLEYVRAKYKRPRLIPFEPKRHSAQMAVPRS